MRSLSSSASLGEGVMRTRPLSAAPVLVLDVAKLEMAEPVNTGLLSPSSPPSSELAFYGQYYGDDEDEDEGDVHELQTPALGTFADLRRKLYGGDVHSTATTAEA
ncbi:hypothetical protein FBU31_005352 [Coemansia sp. 'formosensis']|nr:hypothetical protein FBU31_005352 [Coemansia sp. 'formosensis']